MTRSTIDDAAIVTLAPDVLGSEVGSEVVMLSLRDGTYYGLDEVGADIWRMIQTPIAVARIVASLSDTYDVDLARCRADVLHLIHVLRDRGLVQVSNSP